MVHQRRHRHEIDHSPEIVRRPDRDLFRFASRQSRAERAGQWRGGRQEQIRLAGLLRPRLLTTEIADRMRARDGRGRGWFGATCAERRDRRSRLHRYGRLFLGHRTRRALHIAGHPHRVAAARTQTAMSSSGGGSSGGSGGEDEAPPQSWAPPTALKASASGKASPTPNHTHGTDKTKKEKALGSSPGAVAE